MKMAVFFFENAFCVGLFQSFYDGKVRANAYDLVINGVASGYCLAGGFELLLCCDFRLVEENTSIGFPETGIGLLPIAGGVSRIGHEVSRPKALEILFNSANLDVQELKNLGVVNDIFKTEEMEDKIQKYIDKIITSTPESVEVLMKNIDKVRSLNIQDSFLLEEEMGKELF